MSSYARANVRIANERKIPTRASRGLTWENKMYKLKRSILALANGSSWTRDFSEMLIVHVKINGEP